MEALIAAEVTVADLAETVIELTRSRSQLRQLPLPADDPLQRKPDISLARKGLARAPTTALPDGLKKTVEYFDNLLRSASLQNQQTR